MGYVMKPLTDAEKDAFLKANYWGILSFAGNEPYAIPVGYQYVKGDILLGFQPVGRKQTYIGKSKSVCLVICRPSKLAAESKDAYPYNTVIIEGELETIDRAKYGLPPVPAGYKGQSFRVKQKRVGTQLLAWT
jgi:nitroimidazol reductase NimA-like FMN-containing flavoprotein (pyridoxamine 5'-phosphate oxidase superfamily)